ncbi:MAG: PAS domain S-box protein [Sediminibacterium sp.]
MTDIFLAPDKEKNFQGHMVYVLAILWAVVTGVIVSVGFFYFPQLWSRWLTFFFVSLFIAVSNLTINRFGYSRLASWSLTIMQWLFITLSCYSGGGILATGILSQMSVILTAGILLGWRGGLAIGLLTIAADFGLAYLEVTGHLPVSSVLHDPISRWISNIIAFGTILALQYYATNHLRTGLTVLQSEVLKREEAEKKLKDYKYALDIASIVSISDVDGPFTFVNENFCKASKYSSEELLGNKHEIIGSGYHSPDYFTELRTAMQDGKPYRGEFCNKAKDGTFYWVDTVIIPFLDETGKVYQYLSINYDITERKEGELKLLASEETMRQIMDSSLDAIVCMSMEGMITTWTAQAEKIFGWKAEEVIEKQLSEIIIPQRYREAHEKGLKYYRQHGVGKIINKITEIVALRRDGTEFPVELTVVLVQQNNHGYFCAFVRDITARKEADLKLQQSEERNRTMIENMSDGLMLLNENLEVIYQSPSIQRINGYTLEERKTNGLHQHVHPEDVYILKDVIQKAVANPNEPFFYQIRIIHKSGKYIWIDASMINLLNNPSIGAIMINCSDITDSKKATELFNYQFYNSPDIILIVNKIFIVETINRVATDRSGIEDVIGKNCIDILPLGSQEMARAALTMCFETGENQEFENTLMGGRWVKSRMVAMVVDGKISHVMIFASDITKRKLAEGELQRSEIKNSALIENIAEAIVLIDEEENIIFQSPAVTRISGYLPEDSYGKKLYAPVYPGEVEAFRAFLQDVINSPGKSMQAQFRIIHKKGHVICLEGTFVNMLHNESIKAIVVNYRDVTERMEAEEAMRESEQLLRKITSQVPGNTYMFEIEANGHAITLFSNRGTDSYNHSFDLEDINEDPGKIIEIVHEDDKLKFNDAMKKAYRTRLAISFQYRIVVNNAIRWRWMQAVPEKNKEGKIIWYGSTSDITPLVDYIASIEQIVFDIGHVIRRPISSMLGMTRLINDNDLPEKEIKELSKQLYPITQEMDKFIREINLAYYQKRQDKKFSIDVSSLIDKRDSLFE